MQTHTSRTYRPVGWWLESANDVDWKRGIMDPGPGWNPDQLEPRWAHSREEAENRAVIAPSPRALNSTLQRVKGSTKFP